MQKQSLIILFVSLAVLLVLGGYAAIQMATSENKPIASFEQCVEAGHPVRQSYPEVCAIPGGQSFTNPTQAAPAPLSP